MPRDSEDQTSQYFTPQPPAESRPARVRWTLPQVTVNLWTDRGVFSRGKVDRGTHLLSKVMELPAEGEILDLGAGYGPLGLAAALRWPAAQITLVEVNERAAELAERNARLNRLDNVQVMAGDAPEVLGERRFDAIVCNPPLRAGKAAVVRLLADAAGRLRPDGALWLVARTAQGAKTLARDLHQWFGAVETVDITGGYRVLKATEPCMQDQGGEDL